jgi:ribosomal protein S18 acetylase RimI-like enzyme
MDRALAWRVEDACLNAWPSLRSVLHRDWLLRFGGGLSRRSNSVNPLRDDPAPLDAQLADFAELYRAQNLPLIVRLLSILDPQIERALDRAGFAAEGETCTLFGDLSLLPSPCPDPAAEVLSTASAEWLAAMSRLQQHSPEKAATYRRVIDLIALPAGFAAVRRDGEIVATAYGALHDGLLCCESVVVGDQHRGQGIGRQLITALLNFAVARGTGGACLQVEASNTAGRALYRSVGLTTELHRYHHRRAPDPRP